MAQGSGQEGKYRAHSASAGGARWRIRGRGNQGLLSVGATMGKASSIMRSRGANPVSVFKPFVYQQLSIMPWMAFSYHYAGDDDRRRTDHVSIRRQGIQPTTMVKDSWASHGSRCADELAERRDRQSRRAHRVRPRRASCAADGLGTNIGPTPAVALGAYEMTPIDVAAVHHLCKYRTRSDRNFYAAW